MVNNGIEFKKVIKDFITDLLTTFPELSNELNDDLKAVHEEKENEQIITNLLNYTKNVYPERFFDILYKNVDIFKTYDINTKFLPGIEFSVLWNDDNISDKTREIIWKYLQVILFIIIGDVNEKDLFGKSAEIFEEMDETELKDKLFDAVSNMHDMFDLSNETMDDVSGEGQLPNPEDIHNHLNSLLNGKLGNLAKEIAEETVKDLNINIDEDAEPEKVFEKLFKNPNKLMNMASSVGKKLDSKIKSGNVKESELIEEATELMEKMKNMPGMDKMESLFKNMPGMAGMAGGGKMDLNAMQNHLNNNLKTTKMKERMKKKLDERKNSQENMPQPPPPPSPQESVKETFMDIKDMETSVFSTGEKVERSSKKKKKNNKKGKGKK